MKVQSLVSPAALMLLMVSSTAPAQVGRCYYVDGVRQCDGGGTVVVVPHRTGDYLEDYGRRRQVRKAYEADEADALDRRDCRRQAVEAANKRDYKRAKALAAICP
jgi:hypothetical protein